MKKRLKYSLLLVLSALVLLHCNQDKQIVSPHTLTIFPLEQAQYRITYVRDTSFTTAGRDKGIGDVYFKKELIGAEEEDLLGRPISAVQVFRSDSFLYPTYDFKPSRVYSQYLEPQEAGDYYAERIEENQRFIALQFPVFEGVSWNGNLYNNLGPETYRYQTIDTTVVIRGKTYENCVMVVQRPYSKNFISEEYAYEIYAPGIGLVKKYIYVIVKDLSGLDPFNPDESRVYIEEIEAHN
ncbi:MAG: hypothetical protein AB8H47_12440 [Bacteroidia bacterium]